MTGIDRRMQCRCARGRPRLTSAVLVYARPAAAVPAPAQNLAADRGGDAGSGDAEPLEQLVGPPAARNVAHGEALHHEAVGRDRLADRVAQTARRVVVLDGDQPAARPARGVDQGTAVHRLHRVGVDDAQ